MLDARKPDAPLIHEDWGDNIFLETRMSAGQPEPLLSAPIKVNRKLRMSRQCMAPLEGRGVVAQWDNRLEQLTVYTSTQIPHIVRSGLSECLGLDESSIRAVSYTHLTLPTNREV